MMRKTSVIIFSICFYSIGRNRFVVSEHNALSPKIYPEIFQRNNTEDCPDNHYFCKIYFRLRSKLQANSSELWKKLERETTPQRFRRDFLYRGFCSEINPPKIDYSELKEDGIVGDIERSYCAKKSSVFSLIDSMDVFFGISVVSYLIFMAYCTTTTYFSNQENKGGKAENTGTKYIQIFSIINIWEDILKPNKNEDFQRLLSIQGMRTLAMMMIVVAHNFITMGIMFTYNPEFVESFYIYGSYLLSSFAVLVQIFFTISAWLLAVQLQNIVKRNGKITLNDLMILALNRYFRLIPAVIVALFLHRSRLIESTVDRVQYSLVLAENNRCRSYGWTNLFFIQNFSIFEGQICSPGTWYIASDTQMYLLLAGLFYVSERFKIQLKYLLGAVFVYVSLLQIHYVLTTEHAGFLRFNLSLLPPESIFSSPEFLNSYASICCNMGSYIVGFIFGTYYSRNKQRKVFDSNMKKFMWFTSFVGLPLLSLYLVPSDYPRKIEALLSITLKPLFSIGIAVGLLGLADGVGGFIKSFFESKPLVFIGNFTYSVYMFHFLPVLAGAMTYPRMITLSNSFYVKNLVVDIVSSFIIGFVVYVILEHPCIQLQKMILPQLKSKKSTEKPKDI